MSRKAIARAVAENRPLSLVVTTNLSQINDEHLAFFKECGIGISTSLDGPESLHNANRPRPGGDSYARVIAGIAKCRAALGQDQVAALMTTTRASLGSGKEIVDEYLRNGFTDIFLRPLSPFGFANKTKKTSECEHPHIVIGQVLKRHRLAHFLEARFIGKTPPAVAP